uniref:Uncharacterized protein n=2 Tax=Ixodes scapularis TaxID=6945 RepID=A0A1S4KNW8_IXOSC
RARTHLDAGARRDELRDRTAASTRRRVDSLTRVGIQSWLVGADDGDRTRREADDAARRRFRFLGRRSSRHS